MVAMHPFSIMRMFYVLCTWGLVHFSLFVHSSCTISTWRTLDLCQSQMCWLLFSEIISLMNGNARCICDFPLFCVSRCTIKSILSASVSRLAALGHRHIHEARLSWRRAHQLLPGSVQGSGLTGLEGCQVTQCTEWVVLIFSSFIPSFQTSLTENDFNMLSFCKIQGTLRQLERWTSLCTGHVLIVKTTKSPLEHMSVSITWPREVESVRSIKKLSPIHMFNHTLISWTELKCEWWF